MRTLAVFLLIFMTSTAEANSREFCMKAKKLELALASQADKIEDSIRIPVCNFTSYVCQTQMRHHKENLEKLASRTNVGKIENSSLYNRMDTSCGTRVMVLAGLLYDYYSKMLRSFNNAYPLIPE